MNKKITIQFLNGLVYHIDAERLCNKIAARENMESMDWYAKFKRSRELLDDEFKIFEAMEILSWEDLEPIAVMVENEKSLHSLWKNGDRTTSVNW